MGRSIEEIEALMLEKGLSIPSITPMLSNNSNAAIYREWIYIVSHSISLHEEIVELNAEISRPHTINWYRETALSYLDGLELTWKDGQFKYDTDNIEDVELRRVIKYCAVKESSNGELVFKVATEVNGIRQPLPNDVLIRFQKYMDKMKAAGTEIIVISRPADILKIDLTVYVDVSIVDLDTGELLNQNEGQSIRPIEDASELYLSNLEFNGAFIVAYFKDYLQAADGVKIPVINDIQWKYAGLPYSDVSLWVVPDSGYFTIEELTINYLPYEVE